MLINASAPHKKRQTESEQAVNTAGQYGYDIQIYRLTQQN